MFKENNQHQQENLLNSTYWMDQSIVNKLSKTWAPFFYEDVFCKIDEKPFAVLYSDLGRNNFPVNILLSLEYIKHMFGYSDDELIENYYFNYLINYALGIRTLGERNLAERTLYEFRERVYTYALNHPGEDDLIFKQFLNLTEGFIAKAGISTKEQRMDSTMIMPNIKKAGRLSLAFDVLSKVVNLIPEELITEPLKKVLEPKFKTETLYKIKTTDTSSKLEKILNLCGQAINICKNVEALQNKDAIKVATRFLLEQAEYNTTTGYYKAKTKESIASDSLQSAYEKDATFRKKSGKSQSGYVVNIAETCCKDNDTQFTTDYKLEQNIKSDVDIAKERISELKQTTECSDLYTDGGYYSKDVIDIGIENEITVHFTDMTGKAPNEEKLPVTSFEYDETTGEILSCPGKQKPEYSSIKNGQVVAHFNKNCCNGCLLRDKCGMKEQKKSNVVRFSQKSIEAATQRVTIKINIKENTSKRAGIEGTNSALKRGYGLGKLRVRGQSKCSVVTGLIITAHNFVKFAKHMLKIAKKTVEFSEPSINTSIFQ